MTGKTVVDLRPMTEEEIEIKNWKWQTMSAGVPIVIELSDGTRLFSINSGNNPALLGGFTPKNKPFTLPFHKNHAKC